MLRRRILHKSGFPVTRLVFDKTISDPANITGHGEGAILGIIAKMRRCLVKKTAEEEVTICYLDNANSNLYADGSPSVLTGNEGDVMVYKPEFWYKYVSTPAGANTFGYDIAAEEPGDANTWIHSPASLIGAYKSNSVDDKLYSRSDVIPSNLISQDNNISYAMARGLGYNIIDYEQHCMIALLFYAKYGNRNSQAVLGAGNQNYNRNNGTTNTIGNADTAGATSGHASFAGIEGVHGCAYEWVGGLAIVNGVWTITDPDGTTRSVNAGTSTGWIIEIAASLGPRFDVIPTAVGGSASTHYADQYQYNSGSRVLARSCSSTSTSGGVSFARAIYDSSNAYASVASRLAFRGVIREAESISAFKSLPII